MEKTRQKFRQGWFEGGEEKKRLFFHVSLELMQMVLAVCIKLVYSVPFLAEGKVFSSNKYFFSLSANCLIKCYTAYLNWQLNKDQNKREDKNKKTQILKHQPVTHKFEECESL